MYPVIRKTNVLYNTDVPSFQVSRTNPSYGASVERYQKRFSKKNEAKLQKKLNKFMKRLAKLQAKTSRFGANVRARRIARLDKKIQAIQMILGMQPFDASFNAEAMTIADQTVSPNPLPLIIGITTAVGLGIFIFTKSRR